MKTLRGWIMLIGIGVVVSFGLINGAQVTAQWGGTTTRVSVASDGTEANEGSFYPSFSADGRWVSFTSNASNLVPGDTNQHLDVFVHDHQTGQTTRVSVASNGEQGNSFSGYSAISANGRWVAFVSDAANLVANDTNGQIDIFVHDRHTGQTTLASVSSNGTQGNHFSGYSAISDDGRWVAFGSGASNLVANDTNGQIDIFVHDRQTGETRRVSVASDGTEGNGSSRDVSVSGDGRFIAFVSASDNLVEGDTNEQEDAFVHDNLTGETLRVSVASDGTQGYGFGFNASISGDGRWVAYDAGRTLTTNDPWQNLDIFLHDLQTRETTRLRMTPEENEANGSSYYASLSHDGRYVTFISDATNLVVGGTHARTNIFWHDRQTGETELISVAPDGTEDNSNRENEFPRTPRVSADGRIIVFASSADNLVSGDTAICRETFTPYPENCPDIFVHDRGNTPYHLFLPLVHR